MEFKEIIGLKWELRWRQPNGEQSFVVPFASNKPFQMVYHGEEEFKYGHYGVHLGQEDRLTFLGDPTQEIKGFFIDCREDSMTFKNKIEFSFYPSTDKTLCIPQGVAHSFDNLENVFTINDYNLYLPDKNDFENGTTLWNPSGDVINLDLDVNTDDIIGYKENKNNVSLKYYQLVAYNQKKVLSDGIKEYTYTQEININNKLFQVRFNKNKVTEYDLPEWEGYSEIEGLGWNRHLILKSGETSGFVPFTECKPYYIIEHGHNRIYTHDAFGIHLGQQDRLTFVGDPNQMVKARFIDMRENSPTKFNKVEFEFKSSPYKFLVIPPGVAHAFESIQKIFTINQPFIFTDDVYKYQPANDVIDWPINNTNYKLFKTSKTPLDDKYYYHLAIAQAKIMESPPVSSAYTYLFDENGKQQKVILRKKNDNE
ncbi:MAG: dTDP-4-dehydrorhamnose 3,5-epimerase family protein [Chitinophagales bacterium]|jgi:dTDP-4-dehydrorhamnose 3,5-epimerase-like enzyme|nr:dTDP-4-dehydrorhamnose 3,5-epimerase family protein [Chitinophagales bacterium]